MQSMQCHQVHNGMLQFQPSSMGTGTESALLPHHYRFQELVNAEVTIMSRDSSNDGFIAFGVKVRVSAAEFVKKVFGEPPDLHTAAGRTAYESMAPAPKVRRYRERASCVARDRPCILHDLVLFCCCALPMWN